MMMIPDDAEKIEVDGASVDFVVFQNEGITYYAFDTSRCGPPDPMVNAVAGLRLIDAPQKRLIMVNHKMPMGLFDKIGEDFKIDSSIREDGLAEVVFSYKAPANLDDSRYAAKCHG
ncbi:MAG: hypothetical protein ACXWB0_07820 [Sulfuricurvum sp.]